METVPTASSLFTVLNIERFVYKMIQYRETKAPWILHVDVSVYLMAAPTYSPAITVKHTFVRPNRVGLAGSGLKQVWFRV